MWGSLYSCLKHRCLYKLSPFCPIASKLLSFSLKFPGRFKFSLTESMQILKLQRRRLKCRRIYPVAPWDVHSRALRQIHVLPLLSESRIQRHFQILPSWLISLVFILPESFIFNFFGPKNTEFFANMTDLFLRKCLMASVIISRYLLPCGTSGTKLS